MCRERGGQKRRFFWVYSERKFTTETQSTQSSEYFLMEPFYSGPPRLGGEFSDLCSLQSNLSTNGYNTTASSGCAVSHTKV